MLIIKVKLMRESTTKKQYAQTIYYFFSAKQ